MARRDPPRTIPEPVARRRRRRARYHSSPADWRNELIYFLLPDRFSDERDIRREPVLDRTDLAAARPADRSATETWYWNHWAVSGRSRFQGGTIRGITARLDYLQGLGITTLWIGSLCRQRVAGVDINENLDGTDDAFYAPKPEDLQPAFAACDFQAIERKRDDYHCYAIQNFLDVDPRLGTRQDLKDLVRAAHKRNMYVVLDIVINHTGENWLYDVPPNLSPLRPRFQEDDSGGVRYPFGAWLDEHNKPINTMAGAGLDDGVWPEEFQRADRYSRRGSGDYGRGYLELSDAEFRVSDYRNRDLDYPQNRPSGSRRLRFRDRQQSPNLVAMTRLWSWWIAEYDLDGFRVDTFKHVPEWVAEDFTRDIRSFAKTLGKDDFLVMGEVGGSDAQADTFLVIDGVRLLELGGRRNDLRELGAGNGGTADRVLLPSVQSLQGLGPRDAADGDPRTVSDNGLSAENLALYRSERIPERIRDDVVTTIDDHDGLSLDRQTRIAGRYGEYAVLPAVAGLLFGPGVPCVYYGTEQALAGPKDAGELLNGLGWIVNQGKSAADDCAGWGNTGQGGDRYLREAMFGPVNPRRAGREGIAGELEVALPGFGPGGSVGRHVFDETSKWYRGVAAMASARKSHPVLASGSITRVRYGAVDGQTAMGDPLPDQLIAWARHDDDGNVGLIVVDVTPPRVPVSRSVELLLPRSVFAGVDSIQGIVEIDAQNLANPALSMQSATSVPVYPLPQSGMPSVKLGTIENRSIQVFVAKIT